MEELHGNISFGIIDDGRLNIVGVVLITLSINRRHYMRGKDVLSQVHRIPATATNSNCRQHLYINFGLGMRCKITSPSS